MLYRAVNIANLLERNKAVVIYGPRQVGKTTLVQEFLAHTNLKYEFFSGDQLDFVHDFSQCNLELMRKLLGKSKLLVIDEAQRIENIGRAIKLVLDRIPDVYVIATGSSSFDLANATDEPLTGRKNLVTLYPMSMLELNEDNTQYALEKKLWEYLVYGTYPNIITYETFAQKRDRIVEIKDAYLFKDILEFHQSKKSKVIINLLKLLAFQLGNEVSTLELGTNLGLDHKTVLRYLELLEKSFVIFKLNGFSRNLRKEITKMGKYYFYDLGIRNALIANFNDLETRDDVGRLWENFLLLERIKKNNYLKIPVNYYFWRTYEQQELDLVEERDGKLYGYEFKWQQGGKKPPSAWLTGYKGASYEVITRKNYLSFVI